ncbi:MAG: sulfurtransferase, partial [Shewanella sp.]|nr:sulfurtransferase [Shewanella sp.]
IEDYQDDDSWQLVDVREDREWLKDRLPRAVHLGRGVIERDIETRFPDKSRPLLLYCGGGYRSVLSAHNLQLMGYTKVASLVGGYRAWVQRLLPLVKD